jgi:two-component system KDP operon response regulator KdpE
VTDDGAHVLIVDDEPQILRGLKVVLRSAGFQVAQAATKREALDAIAVRPPDVIILDLVLPDGNGVEVTREVRRWSSLPIIVLSAVGDEREKVRALDAGADDYVTKPFGTEELTARIRAALRRRDSGDTGDAVVRVGAVTIDLAARRVTRDGAEVHLTPIEFRLLETLARNRGRLMTHRTLLVAVWGAEYADDVTVLRGHIANLRRKIEPGDGPRYIRTDPGVGYRFTA